MHVVTMLGLEADATTMVMRNCRTVHMFGTLRMPREKSNGCPV